MSVQNSANPSDSNWFNVNVQNSQQTDKEESKNEVGSLKAQESNEKKLSALFQFLHKFIFQKFAAGAFKDQ